MRSNHIRTRVSCLAATALLLFGLAGVRQASAYLTSHVGTSGYVSLDLDDTTTRLDDTVANWEKQVSIANTGDGECMVRAKFFVADRYADYITYSSQSALWYYDSSDGYWYYDGYLEPGQSTAVLNAKLDSDKFSADFTEDGTLDFNVIVVHEYARAQYDSSGNKFVDWNEKIVPDTQY